MTDPERGAAALAREHFGIDGHARALPGEQDLNFLITSRGASRLGEKRDKPRRIVLKVGPRWRRGVFNLVASALRHIEKAALSSNVPRPVMPLPADAPSGSACVDVDFLCAPHVAAATTYLDGICLADLRPPSMTILMSLGRLLAELGNSWSDFDHPELARTLTWRMESAPETIRDHIRALDDGDRRLVRTSLDRAMRRLDAVRDSLGPGVIHNDANDHNVMVTASLKGDRLAGLIDFGDVVRGWRATDVAVASAYAMMGLADPVDAACALARGYSSRSPLTDAECDAVMPLTALRLCLSISVQAKQMWEQPDNAYLAVSQEPARELLSQLASLDWRLAAFRIREACGLVPNPAERRVTAWIRHARPRAPVISRELLRRPCILDLSVESAELPLDTGTGVRAAERWVLEQIQSREATVGVGRYNEARLLYDDPAFQGQGNSGPETRTVHLGLDLFVPAGTPVHAPLSGVVTSVENRTRTLDYGPTVVVRHVTADGTGFHTLYGHLDRPTLTHTAPGQRLREGDILGWVGDFAVNGGWPPHLHLQVIAVDPMSDDSEAEGGSGRQLTRGVVLDRLRTVGLSVSPDPTPLAGLGDDPGAVDTSARAKPPDAKDFYRRRAKVLGPSLSLSYEQPLHIVRGRGAYLYDAAGRAYLDTVNNVAHVGHCNSRVTSAITRQARVLNTNTRYLHREIVLLGEELLDRCPAPLDIAFMVCSGSEANELALRLARTYTSKTGVICLEGGYHGNTDALVEISPYKFDGPGGQGRTGRVAVVAMPDVYRGKYREDEDHGGSDGAVGATAGQRYAREVQQAARRLQHCGVAAFVAESILGCGGQIEPPPGYLSAAYAHARAAGGVTIADEIQVGFGRVGDAFWAFELQGVVPDILTLGKPMGNGHPIAAVVTTRDIAAAFDNGMEYFNSFGGNPVSCAAARATLAELQDRDLIARARHIGALLTGGLRDLGRTCPLIGDVRGRGLFLGVELVRDRETREPFPEACAHVAERARALGVLLSVDGPDHNVIKIKPPMVFSEADAERTVRVLGTILDDSALRTQE